MKNQVNESAKIEQLLGELGTISPPFLNNKEQLKRLASELYLLADLLTEESAQDSPTVDPVPVETQTLHIPNLQPNHTDWSNPIPELEMDEDLHPPTVFTKPEQPAAPVNQPAPPLHTPEIQAPPITEKLPEHPAEPVLPPAPPAPKVEVSPVQTPPSHHNIARDLHKSLPLVKRIEFINRLFAGKEDEWQHFCRQVNQASHAEAALNIYREHFIRMSWEKNADSADQLKQVIVKICA